MRPAAAAPEQRRPTGGFPLVIAVLLLIAANLGGCATLSSDQEAERTLFPSSLAVVGHVVWVDRSENTAVIELKPGASVSIQPLLARNDAMVETARLQATAMRQGQTLGTRIVDGLPNVGDEVVVRRERE